MENPLTPPENPLAVRFRRGGQALAAATLLLGLLAMAASQAGISLEGMAATGIARESARTAQTLAGIGFALLGLGQAGPLAFPARRILGRWLRRSAGTCAAGYALLQVLDFLPAGVPGLDPITLALFVLLGASLAAMEGGRGIMLLAQVSALLVIFACTFILTAHLYGAHTLYLLPSAPPMYWPTAAVGLVAGLAVLGLRPEVGVMPFLAGEGPGSALARRLLPAVPLMIVGLGWIRLLGEQRRLYPTEFGLAIFSMINVTGFTLLIVLTAVALNRGDRVRRAREERIAFMNRELDEKSRGLEAAVKELESFSYSVSHDLRAPLRHIAGFGRKLEAAAGDALNDKSRRYLEVILRSTDHMGCLIDDLLQFSRAGRAGLNKSRVRMDILAEEVAADLREANPGRAVKISIPSLPEVDGDPILLRQVWANLLGNAWKYTRLNPAPRIEVSCRPGNGRGYAFSVRDNGAGFDMRHADKLFGVFQRLHSQEEYEGTGIGLALVRRIVERHGGEVWAQGLVGQGAEFGFRLPRAAKGKESPWSA